jgi:hypothetical protein
VGGLHVKPTCGLCQSELSHGSDENRYHKKRLLMKSNIPVSVPRAKEKLSISIGDKVIPNKGPISVIDNCLYSSPSNSTSNRLTAYNILTDVGYGAIASNYCFGPYADELLETSPGRFTPNATVVPAFQTWKLRQPGFRYDTARDCIWISEFISDLPIYGRDPLSGVHEIFPPNSFDKSQRVTHKYEFCSDYVTKDFPYFRDRGVSVHSPACLQTYGSHIPKTFWVKAVLWNMVQDPVTRITNPTTIADTKYMRIDVLGLETALIRKVGPFKVLGLENIPTNPGFAFASLYGSIFADCESNLDEYMVRARDKASKGTMEFWVTLVEARKTVDLVKSVKRNLYRLAKIQGADLTLPFSRLSTIVFGFKLNRKGAVKALSQKWLESRYGWRQIIFDGQGIYELILSFFKKIRVSYTSGTSKTGELTESLWSDPVVLGTGTAQFQIGGYARVRAGVSVAPNFTDTWYKRLYLRLGEINIHSLYWELTYASWVIDWMWDFGAFLRTVTSNPARFHRAWHTIHVPYEEGTILLKGMCSLTDLRDALLASNGAELSGEGKSLIQRWLNDEEEVFDLTGRNAKVNSYLRIVKDPSRFPLVIPKGIGLNKGTQLADALSLFMVIGK